MSNAVSGMKLEWYGHSLGKPVQTFGSLKILVNGIYLGRLRNDHPFLPIMSKLSKH